MARVTLMHWGWDESLCPHEKPLQSAWSVSGAADGPLEPNVTQSPGTVAPRPRPLPFSFPRVPQPLPM